MLFIDGFEKTAISVKSTAKLIRKVPAAEAVAERAVKPIGMARRSGEYIRKSLRESAESIQRGAEKGIRQKKKVPGETFAEIQVRKLHKKEEKRLRDVAKAKKKGEKPPEGRPLLSGDIEDVRKGSKKKVMERYQLGKEKAKQRARGPSFAMRHPLITAGGGLLAGKAIFGEKAPPTPGPHVSYPTEQYAGQGTMGQGYY